MRPLDSWHAFKLFGVSEAIAATTNWEKFLENISIAGKVFQQ